MLGDFFIMSYLLIFFKFNFFKTSFGNTIRVSNSLDPDQAHQNCLQRLSVGDTDLQRVMIYPVQCAASLSKSFNAFLGQLYASLLSTYLRY